MRRWTQYLHRVPWFRTTRRRPRPRNPRPLALVIESLESRVAPAILFNPLFGTETQKQDNGDVLKSPGVYLIFWGSWWGSNTAAELSVMITAGKVLSSPYLSGLTQYHSDGLAHIEPISVYDSTNPSNLNFDTGKIDDVIQTAVDQGLLPEPDGPPHMPIYVVVTPPGIQSSYGTGVIGFNQVGHDVDFCGVMPCDFDDLPEIWSWTGNSKDNNGIYYVNLDQFSQTLSHEVVELMSDRGGGGYEVNPGSKWAAGGSGNQIGDYEGNSYAWREVNGASVQPYWSAKDSGWLAPDGNSQVMYLNPIWQWNGGLCLPIDCSYTGQNALTVNGDQPGFGPNDTITIAKTAAGGVQVTLNGEVFPFDPNQITSITVKPGAGSNVINVESLPANVTLTINDAANSQDTVNLSPSAHNVTNIQGSVNIASSSPATTLTAFDQMNPQAHNVNLNFQNIVGLTQKPIAYQNLASLSFYVGQGTNVDTINDPSKLSRIFYWQEGAGFLQIDGGSSQTNTLEITGKQTGEQFSVWATTSTLEFVLQNQNSNTVGHIYATGVQNLMMDEADSGNLYTINDLSKTSVQQVYVNMHAAGGPNGALDRVIVNGSAVADDQVIASTGAPTTFVDQQAIPIGKATGAYTNVDLTMKYPCSTFCPPPSHYQVKVAIPKPVDKLTINTFGGKDTVSVRSTQPRVQAPATGGHVYVNTGDGDDQITVGDPNDGLDNLFGPLDIDAGTGHNKVTFDETGSYVHDIVMLSASQLIRYTQTSPVTITRDGRTLTQTGYPFIINYKATQGDFLPGVNFKSSFGSTDLYLPETGTNAPLTVTAQGSFQNSHDNVVAGFDGAFPPSQSQVIVQNIVLTPQFPTTRAGSTLAGFHSTTLVHGLANAQTALEVNDAAAPNGQTYTLGVLAGQGILARAGASLIVYDGSTLHFTLNAGNQGSQVSVPGVLQATTAAINSGNGNDTIRVGDSLNLLNGILGPLTINGGSGNNVLTIHDEGSNLGMANYVLTETTLQRSLAALITYLNIQTFTLYAGSGGNSVTVLGTAVPTIYYVYTGAGSDHVQLGNPASSLGLFLGTLTLDGQGGTNPLTVYDGPPNGGQSYVITSTSVKRGTHTVARYQNMSSLGFYSGGGNTIFVESTATTVPVTVYGGSTAEIINIGTPGAGDPVGTIAGTVTFNAGTGAAAVSVGTGGASSTIDNVQAPVTINGKPGFNTVLTLNDQGHPPSPARIYTVTPTQVTRTGPPVPVAAVNYFNVAGLVVNGSSSYVVTATSTPTTLHTGPGDDTITVGDSTNTLNGIQAALIIDGGTGTNTLTLNDQGNNGSQFYTLTATTLTRTFMAPISYANIRQLILNGTPKGNSFNIQGTAVGSSDTVLAGAGSDIINLGNGANSLDALQGTLTIDGQGGTNTLVINDQGTATPNLVYTLTATTFQRSNTGLVRYASMQALILNTGSGADLVNIQGSGSPLYVNTFGGGQDLITVGNMGSLQNIQGAVTIGVGSQGAAQVKVDDSTDTTARNVTLATAGSSGTISGLLPNNALITYALAHVAGLTVAGGTSGNLFQITGTGDTFPTTVNPGMANDQVVVRNSSAMATLALNAGSGDSITLSNGSNALDGIGHVTVNDPSRSSTLLVDDSGYGGGDSYNLSAATVTIGRTANFQLTLGNLANLVLNGSASANVFTVTATPTGTAVTLNADASGDQIGIQGTAAMGSLTINTGFGDTVLLGTGGTLAGIGQVLVQDGTASSVVGLDDSTYGGNDNYVIADPTVSVARLANFLLTYVGIGQLQLKGGATNKTFDIDSTSVPTLVQASGSSNCFHLSPFTQYLASIAGAVTLQGGGSDVLDFFDVNNPAMETYTFDSIPSMLALATLPSFAANWSGMDAVYLETNGMSTVQDPSNSVVVDPAGGPPCLPNPPGGAGQPINAKLIPAVGPVLRSEALLSGLTGMSPASAGRARPSVGDDAFLPSGGTRFDGAIQDDLVLTATDSPSGQGKHDNAVLADLAALDQLYMRL